MPLMGRSAILGEQRNNYFCDVGCGRGEMGDSTYAITKSGLLCEFNNRRLLDKWVELRVSLLSATCLKKYFPVPAIQWCHFVNVIFIFHLIFIDDQCQLSGGR